MDGTDAGGLDAFNETLTDAIVAAIERGGPAAVAEFLAALAETCGRPPGYLYGLEEALGTAEGS